MVYRNKALPSKEQQVSSVTRVGIDARHAQMFYIKWTRLRHSSKLRGAECRLSFT